MNTRINVMFVYALPTMPTTIPCQKNVPFVFFFLNTVCLFSFYRCYANICKQTALLTKAISMHVYISHTSLGK